MKIRVSYTEDGEAALILKLLRPILGRFKVKKNTGKPPYNHLYFTPINSEKTTK